MREILFRGKCKEIGEWVEGSLIVDERGNCYIGQYIPREKSVTISSGRAIGKTLNRFVGIGFVMVDKNTVGQYTGLTGKNGKKIFEGDIILFEDESPSNYEYHDCTEMRCGEMRFDDGEFYLTNRIAVQMGDLIYDGKLDGTIVGNVHDNPELLEQDNR